MNKKKTLDRSVLAVGVVGSLVLLNVVGLTLFGRLDLTSDRQFTLSKATRDTLADLKEPVTVRAYFSADLPPPFSTNARYVKDLLDEYYAHAGGNFRYEFLDPAAAESDSEKDKKKDLKQDIFGRTVREATGIERELQELGIPPVQVRVNEADKVETRRAYMGLVVNLGEKKEVIPVVKETSGLEYDLTTLIRKVAREKTPKIGLITGHESLDPQKDLGRVWQLLSQNYALTTVDLGTGAIPGDVDALIVAGPKAAFSDAEKRALDAFVMAGHGVAFLLDSARADLQSWQATDTQHGLGDVLAAYGVKLLPGFVLDAECGALNLTQQRGFMRITQAVQYPFVPVPRTLDAQHPLTRGLSGVAFPFMSPIATDFSERDGVKIETLVKSSERSWVQEPPYNLDPTQRWTQDVVKEEGSKALVVAISGPISSYAGGGAKASNARVLVAGGSTFITDQFLSPANEALAANMVDWLVMDEALMSVRSRGLGAAPLAELGEAAKSSIKYFNVLGVPLALVAVGLVRWRVRERRRREVRV